MTGSGTEGDPYIIQDVGDLQNISLDLTAYYELGNHIECLGYDFTMLGVFTGSLDGKDFEIRDLTIVDIAGQIYSGLFQQNQGTIKNVHLRDCVIDLTHTVGNASAAALVRWNDAAGVIENCSATGTVAADGDNVGVAAGLVAQNDGSISGSWADVVCSAIAVNNAVASGFVRENTGPINDCYARGNATAVAVNAYAAGFIDHNFATGVITNAHSTGAPTAANIGGFCQDNGGTITACFWDIETSGTGVSDGGTGKTTSQMKQKGTFSEWDIGYTSTYRNDGYPFLGWEIGSSSTWLIYGTAYNGGPPGIEKPTVVTLPATGVS